MNTFLRSTNHNLFRSSSFPYVAIYILYLLAAANGIAAVFQEPSVDPMMGRNRTDIVKRYNSLSSKVDDIIKLSLQKRSTVTAIVVSDEVTTKFLSSNCKRQKEILATVIFEFKNKNINLHTCVSCFGDIMDTACPTETVHDARCRTTRCEYCKKHNHNRKKNVAENMLPYWSDQNGEKQFTIPQQLLGLTFGEKLLIQKNSALVPCVHMFKGKLGIKGHTVMFPKNLSNLCTELPRQRLEVIKVIRETSHSSDNDTSYETDTFKIRKTKVMQALMWLKTNHSGYREITIREDNMNWMGGKNEGILPPSSVQIAHTITEQQQESVSVYQTDPFMSEAPGMFSTLYEIIFIQKR